MEGASDSETAVRRERIDSIDLLRGGVMVLMALDHARDYFGDFTNTPEDLTTTTPALFFTRWVTHFCAPVFVFLAGTSARLWGRGRPRGELARFLVTRGAWLIALEFTVVHFGWFLTFSYGWWVFQVIAAIGVGMIALAGLVLLPGPTALFVGLAIVLGHDLLHPIEPADLGGAWRAWTLLHEGILGVGNGFVPLPGGFGVIVAYPVLPWIGVLATGYGCGRLLERERAERARILVRLGLALCVAFLVVRGANAYGDPDPWVRGESPLWTAMSFLNCRKYPPSLAFLLMTLGPALLALGLLERRRDPLPAPARAVVTFGRVPLFYYLLHLYLLHVASGVLAYFEQGSFQRFDPTGQSPPQVHGLEVVYAAWVLAVLALLPLCAAYARFRRRARHPFWSYL